MYKADYHMHTSFSPDSDEKLERQIEAAIDKGFKEICITDHFEKEPKDGKIQFTMDLSQYIQTVREYKEKYSNKIKIMLGIEVDYDERYADEIIASIQKEPFDFIICSTHKCEGEDIYYRKFFEGKEQTEAYQKYFEKIYFTLKQYDYFNVYGHLDYVARYGNYANKILDVKNHKDIIHEILKIIIDKGKGLEVNTSGIRYGLGHFNPQIPILKMYLDMGGEIITIGSDAHSKDQVGYLWEEAANMLSNIGFKHFTTFENRKPQFHKL